MLNQDPKASQSNVDAAAKKISDDINNLNQGTDAANNKPVIPTTKTPVGDNSHLTDDEKGQVKDNVQESNPAGKVTNVDDHGNTTITYPDGSKNVVSGKDTTTGTSKDNLNKSIDSGNNTKTSGNYANTSDQNRADLDNAIKHGQDVANNQNASQKDIDEAAKAINKAIDNVNNGQTDASKNKPVIPTTKTSVGDTSHLTDDEKSQVKDNVQKSNPAGKVTNVDDHGNTTITYPDGSKNVVSGKDTTTGTSKDDLNKAINNGNSAKTSGNYANTSDQNRADLDNAIKHGQDVANNQNASQKDIDEAAKAINKAIDNVNNGQTDASKNKPVIPTTKTPVGDNSHLTDDEKSQVKDNVQKSNSNGKVTNVDDNGNTTITYPDGSKNVISGKDTTTGTSKDDLNKAINNGNSAKTSGNYTNTSDQNRDDLNKAIDHGNQVKNDPHASQKDIDEAANAINKAIDNVNNGQTDASKNKPVIPTTKTPVGDNSHLTDDEKSQVKDNVQKSNSNGKVTNVDDNGNTTIEPAKMVSVKEAAPAEMTAQKAAQAQDQLPQTGEDNSKAAFGLGLASILGGIGILGAFKRKKKEN